MKNRIFLGGTYNNTIWRNKIINTLNKDVEYFNPVVEDWTLECQEIEKIEKESKCNIHFYCITKEMTGVFSIAEIIDSVHNKTKITILHVIPEGFTESQLKSLNAVIDLVKDRGGIAYCDNEIFRSSRILNNCFSNY